MTPPPLRPRCAGLPPTPLCDPPSARTVTVLRDPCRVRRGAQAVCWHPDGSSRLAVAYSVLEFQRQPEGMPAHSYVWDVASPGEPDATLAPPSPLVALAYNLKDSNLLGAGQYNGQVTFFDLRKGSAPVDATPVGVSHRDPVHDFAWTQSKTGSELMSASTDGSVLWWDLRRLGEPLESLVLREKGGEAVLGGTVLEYSPAAGPTKFMVGTEQGTILAGNRKTKNPADRVTGMFTGECVGKRACARARACACPNRRPTAACAQPLKLPCTHAHAHCCCCPTPPCRPPRRGDCPGAQPLLPKVLFVDR